jgi:signal transduction histidine kinase
MAQRIAEAHGGTLIFVDGAGAGAGGAGACFRLVVPVRGEAAA